MPKKQAKFDRDIDLPEWADDVTPADEVMKKFYAPTGSFKIGPIVPQAPAGNTSTAAAPAESPEDKEARSQPRIEKKPEPPQPAIVRDATARDISAPNTRFDEVPIVQTSVSSDTAVPEIAPEVSLSPAASKIPQDSAMTADSNLKLSDSDRLFEPAPVDASLSYAASFEDFVRKWKRYLYPGQMAVMRTLFGLTHALGAVECFIRYSEIAASTKMTRRNCINVVNSLVERGFIERLEVRNDASGKGILLKIYLDPLL